MLRIFILLNVLRIKIDVAPFFFEIYTELHCEIKIVNIQRKTSILSIYLR